MKASSIIGSTFLCATAACGVSRQERALETTVMQAKRAFKTLRPDADLRHITVRLARGRLDWSALIRDERTLLDGSRILRAQTPVLLRLRLISEGDAKRVQAAYGSLNPMVHAHGLAIPSRGLALIVPEQAESVELVAHELGHLASRHAYGRDLTAAVSLRAADNIDPDWVDLDAVLAHLGLAEGEAEVMARAVVAYRDSGLDGVSALWGTPATTRLGQELRGPASITRPDGTRVVLKAGEVYYFAPDDLLDAIYFLVYRASVATFQAHRHPDDSLEQTITRTWKEATWTTQEILFPGSRCRPSRFAKTLRAHDISGASGAARAGAFLVAMMLVREKALPMKAAQDLVADLEDDVIVRNASGGALWLVQWGSERSCERFADLYRSLLPSASVDIEGVRVIVTVGEVPGRDDWVNRLTAPSRLPLNDD